MGLLTRSLWKIVAFFVAGVLAAPDKFWELGNTWTEGSIGFFTFVWEWIKAGVDNLYMKFWEHLSGIVTSFVDMHFFDVVKHAFFLIIAWAIIFIVVYLIMDIYTGKDETPRLKAAIVSIVITLIVGLFASGINWLTAKDEIINTINSTNVTDNLKNLDLKWV